MTILFTPYPGQNVNFYTTLTRCKAKGLGDNIEERSNLSIPRADMFIFVVGGTSRVDSIIRYEY